MINLMTDNNEQYEEGQINGINDNIIDKNFKYQVSNNKIVYYSLCLIIFLIIILIIIDFIFLFFSFTKKEDTKKNDEILDNTKKNAEIITLFFKDGYENKNFEKVKTYMVEDYYDHSPAAARSNADAINILKIVQTIFSNVTVEILDLTCEKDMVAARIWFKVVHIGEFNEIPATGKTITFEALENFKVVNGKIVESWGYWPDKDIEKKLKANTI